jgi:CubicO group peptidase (beta-lactamase class C family)
MSEQQLQRQVEERAGALDVLGVAVGVLIDGRAEYAFMGVTSIDDPLPVDERTLFQIGSTGKTYTATVLMMLVEAGKVDLSARVRSYLPEFRLKDEQVAREVTVLHLLNHTAGWDGDFFEDQGEGDDALARYVARMDSIEQVTPLGDTVSYNNASLSVAGRIIEVVTGKTYEQAVREMLLEPLAMGRSFFFPHEIMTERFAVGHHRSEEGEVKVAKPWHMGRYGNPMGGMVANAADQIAWARFHIEGGVAPDGARLLSEDVVRRMQEPTAHCPGSAIGDAVGISWLLRDVEGVRVVAHGGTTVGQHSIFEMVPSRGFALTALTNCGPNGAEFNEELTRWAFEAFLGIEVRDPEPTELGQEALAAYTGTYETIASICTVSAVDGGLLVEAKTKPEVLEAMGEEETDEPPMPLGILDGEGDRYIVTDGPARGMKGYFRRRPDGVVDGLHVGGRLAIRV